MHIYLACDLELAKQAPNWVEIKQVGLAYNSEKRKWQGIFRVTIELNPVTYEYIVKRFGRKLLTWEESN